MKTRLFGFALACKAWLLRTKIATALVRRRAVRWPLLGGLHGSLHGAFDVKVFTDSEQGDDFI